MRAAFIGLALLTLAACSTAVHSHGTLDSKLHCAPHSVTDEGAPFCYALPNGFTDNSSDRTYCRGWRYCTLVSVAQHDLVQVLAAREPFDADTYSDAKLQDLAEKGLSEVAAAAKSTLTDVTATRVGGVRAYEQAVLTRDGVTDRAVLAFRGHVEVFIQCDQSDHSAPAQQGCARVLGSIQIVPLP